MAVLVGGFEQKRLTWAILFCIRRRSARSEILVQSSLGLAEALKAELVAWVEAYLE